VWYLHTGERRHFFQHDNNIKFAEIVDNEKIVTVDSENVMRMWHLDLDDQLDLNKLVIANGLVWR
jgi:hypothetical protein